MVSCSAFVLTSRFYESLAKSLCCLVLFQATAAADIMLTRDGADLAIENDQRGWLCSVETTNPIASTGTASILLQEVDLATGAVEDPVVLETYSWNVSPTSSCVVLPAPEAGRIVVAYDRVYSPSGIHMKLIRTAHYNPADESVELMRHIWEVWPGATGRPINVQGYKIDGHYFLSWTNVSSFGPWPFFVRFEDYDALRADAKQYLEITENIEDAFAPSSGGLSVDPDSGQVMYNLVFGSCPGDSPRGFRFFTWNSEGDLLTALSKLDLDIGASGPQGCLGQRIFGDRYFNQDTGTPNFMTIAHPAPGTAGYRLGLADPGTIGLRYLADPTVGTYYGIRVTGSPEIPEVSGFPFTVDSILSSDDQWVLASRDYETNRLALHRIPAAFAGVDGPEMVLPGTQRPGPEFCGTARSVNDDNFDEYAGQNMFVDLKEGPGAGELVVTYFTCPGGDPANAVPVVNRFPLDFPVLVDDRDYTTPEETVLMVPAPGVLGNDMDLGAGVLDLFAQAGNGNVVLNADGSFEYTPDMAFCDEDEFTYRVTKDSEEYLARVVIDVTCAEPNSVAETESQAMAGILPGLMPGGRSANSGAGSISSGAGADAIAEPTTESTQGDPPIAVEPILQVGDTPVGGGGAAVVDLFNPVINGNDQVAIQGRLDNGAHFVWFDGEIIFLDSSVGSPSLFGGEVTMGIGTGGEFIYSPFADGLDTLWTNSGQLVTVGDSAPGFAGSPVFDFLSRPTMDDNGNAYWVAGVDTDGNGIVDSRHLYTSPDGTLGSATRIFGSGDVVDSISLGGSESITGHGWGVPFLYEFSNNGNHHIHMLESGGNYPTDNRIYVNGSIVISEAGALAGAPNEAREFSGVAINNKGQYLVAGDLGPFYEPLNNDKYVAAGGPFMTPAAKALEGGTLAGVALDDPSIPIGVGLSDRGCAAQLWRVGDVTNLFLGDVEDIVNDSELVLSTENQLDLDGNGTTDADLVGFRTLYGFQLQVDQSSGTYVLVELNTGSGPFEAVIRVPLTGEACNFPFLSDGFE